MPLVWWTRLSAWPSRLSRTEPKSKISIFDAITVGVYEASAFFITINLLKVCNSTPPSVSVGNVTAGSRISWIDSLKGFAIICVVIGHVALGYLKSGTFPSSNDIVEVVRALCYSFHMPLFFIMSGYAFTLAYVTPEGNVKRGKVKWHVLNLAILYVCVGAFLILLKIIAPQLGSDQASWRTLLMLPVQPFGIYWFLYVLMAVTLIACFSFKFVSRLWVLALSFVLAATAPFFVMTDLFELQRFFYMSPFFLLGILLRKGDLHVHGVVSNVAIVVGAVLLILSFCGFGELRVVNVSSLAIALGVCLLFIRIFQHPVLAESSVLKYCGRHSLEIYLIHCYVISAERAFLPHTNVWVSLLLTSVLATVIPLGVAVLLQKINLHSLIFRPAYVLRDKLTSHRPI